MIFSTTTSGVLCVASACPDPPFEIMDGTTPTGFDVGLTQAICDRRDA
jgi:ABC-type amino acid transport substrate-binding protein